MKGKKLVKILAVFAIVLYILCALNTSFAGTLSSDIDGINEEKYPGVKSLIKDLQSKHSNYHFQVYYTGIDWTEAITMEYQGHGSSPKNLFSESGKYTGKWFCPICGKASYDTGWYCASIDAIAYMMDPRNSLDETSVYQFKNLEASDVSSNDIQTIINKKYASYSYINNATVINAIVNASTTYNLNGYSILAKIVNEQGKGTSPLVTGAGYNGNYVGYYNFFNVGAYGNGTSAVLMNGLSYAKTKVWDTVEKSIMGGSEYYKSSYIGKGQNTLYYQRFNVVNENSLFAHQYQQDIMGAQTSGTLLKNYYKDSSTTDTINHNFIIPLYENMPKAVASRPSTGEESRLEYQEETVLKDKLEVKASPNSSRVITKLNVNEKVKVLKRAEQVSADGNYWDIIVTEADGTYGYVLRSGISEKLILPKYIFDAEYYAENNQDLKAVFGNDESRLVVHYLLYGIMEGRQASATFDVRYYLENNSDLLAVFGNKNYASAYNHFVNYGYKEFRKSSSEYDGTFYRFYNGLLDKSSEELMLDYLQKGKKDGKLAGLAPEIERIVYDVNIYASCNQDVRDALGLNPNILRVHWLQYGIKEGRIASLAFNAKEYFRLNADIQNKFRNNYKAMFEYFVKTGINEERPTSLVFDITTYLDKNPDIKAAFGNSYKHSYLHFLNNGIAEGRTASDVFEVKAYRNKNADLANVYGKDYQSLFIHFINYGIFEKRPTSSEFSIIYYTTYEDLKNIYGKNYIEYYTHYLLYGKQEGRKGID